MTATYEPIATTTLSSATGTVTFSNISGSYTDLILVADGRNETNDYYTTGLRFNSDTGSNYSRTRTYGDGTGSGSSIATNETSANINPATGWPTSSSLRASSVVHIMSYSDTTVYKTLLSRSGTAQGGVEIVSNLWRNTSAITSINILALGSSTFAVGSIFTLYGIKCE